MFPVLWFQALVATPPDSTSALARAANDTQWQFKGAPGGRSDSIDTISRLAIRIRFASGETHCSTGFGRPGALPFRANRQTLRFGAVDISVHSVLRNDSAQMERKASLSHDI